MTHRCRAWRRSPLGPRQRLGAAAGGLPVSPGDHPESVQFTASAPGGALTPSATTGAAAVPIARRTLIPSSGGSFQTLITSADNEITYYLVGPDDTVAATASTPNTTPGQPPGTATLATADPVSGTWEIDVELGLTASGDEFTQTVDGTVTATP